MQKFGLLTLKSGNLGPSTCKACSDFGMYLVMTWQCFGSNLTQWHCLTADLVPLASNSISRSRHSWCVGDGPTWGREQQASIRRKSFSIIILIEGNLRMNLTRIFLTGISAEFEKTTKLNPVNELVTMFVFFVLRRSSSLMKPSRGASVCQHRVSGSGAWTCCGSRIWGEQGGGDTRRKRGVEVAPVVRRADVSAMD